MSNSKPSNTVEVTVTPILVRDRRLGGIHLTNQSVEVGQSAATLCGHDLVPMVLYSETDAQFFRETDGLCKGCARAEA